jgi:alkylation response protein AidB-like acyl-CoA dehydrogenase
MTSGPDEDLKALTAMAATFAQRQISRRVAALAETDSLDRAVLADLAGAGLLQLGLPESAGGQGADLAATARVVFELARVSPSIAMALVHAHTAASALLAAAEPADSAADSQVLIAGFCRPGELTRPGEEQSPEHFAANYPPESPPPTARLDLGLGPDHVLVMDQATAHTYLIPAAAIPPGPPQRRSGLPGLGTRVARFDPGAVARLAWAGDDHQRALAAAVRWWAAGTAMCALGAADAAVERAASYAGTRIQFGTRLTAIPTIARSLEQARRSVSAATSEVLGHCAGSGTWPAGLARRGTNVAVRVCLDMIGVFGGYGYLTEYTVESLLRDAVSLRAAAQAAPAMAAAT